MREGYRLRLAELAAIGNKMLVPLGQVEDILRSDRPSQEKTAAIAEYLDTHEAQGLGDPVRLYVLAPFDDIRSAFDEVVDVAIEASRAYISDPDMQSEFYRRFIAYGYVYRIAEDLVRRGLPDRWKPENGSTGQNGDDTVKSDAVRLWACFRGEKNTTPVLCEKAKVLTSLIDSVRNDALILSLPMRNRDETSPKRLEEEHARRVILENAALFIRIADEIALSALGCELSNEFIDTLIEFVMSDLQGRGLDPTTSAETLKARFGEYAGYAKWVPVKGESARGTLFWEFAKKVAHVLEVGKSAVFNTFLTNVLLRSLTKWQLPELLQANDRDSLPSTR